ncbi:MAG: hypothetical protein LBN01_02255 [Endomicrobium sp.]|nr:hypothetical protein [Endomicrobium sp.]
MESELKISDINANFCKQAEIMEPFGMNNFSSVFCIRSVTPTEISVFGNKEEHLKFRIKGAEIFRLCFGTRQILRRQSAPKIFWIQFLILT